MLHFIHIAKTGGTSLEEFLKNYNIKFNSVHLNKLEYPIKNNDQFLILIRNPIKRFVSTFNYYSSLLHQDISIFNDYAEISLKTCLSPYFTYQKLKNNYYFSPEIDEFIVSIKNVNELAENLTSCNDEIRNKSIELCNYKHFLGFSYYLDDGNFVQEHFKKILWVGKLETINDDIEILKNKLNINSNKFEIKKLRENKNNLSKYLSEKAIQNIINFYQNDYKTLDFLQQFNFIDKETVENYKKYEISS